MTTNTATKNASRKKKNEQPAAESPAVEQPATPETTPAVLDVDSLSGLTPEELIAKILAQNAKLTALEAQTSNRKPRGTSDPKPKTADQIRKDELNSLWEALEVVEGDPIRSKERADQFAALPKLARLLPFNQVPALLEQLADQIVKERAGFIEANKVPDSIDLFGEPRTAETLIEMAMTRKPKTQPKRKTDAEAVKAAEDEHAAGEACPDPDAHTQDERNQAIIEGEQEDAETED